MKKNYCLSVDESYTAMDLDRILERENQKGGRLVAVIKRTGALSVNFIFFFEKETRE